MPAREPTTADYPPSWQALLAEGWRRLSGEPRPDLVWGPTETPRWCARCGVELVDARKPLCGPCRGQGKRR